MSLAPAVVLDELLALGVDSLAGVPCSQLDGLVRRASDQARYVAASSEGEAVAVAAGAWLGGGLGAVLMQNSGLGNAVNPLTSLACTFGLPMLLVVSQRGGQGDAPQHALMGRITVPLLELLELPWRALTDDPREAPSTLAWAVARTREAQRPVALVVAPGTFAADDRGPSPDVASLAPTRLAALDALLAGLDPRDLVLATTGMTSRELAHLDDRPGSFGMVGSMGCAPGLGLGLARARPERRVVVVDGDGALLMKLGSLASVAHARPPNLLHVLLDNGCYESTGGQTCASRSVDFVGLARAAGYVHAEQADDADELTRLVRDRAPGPRFVRLAIAPGRAGVGRVPRAPEVVRDDLRREACS